MLHRIGRGPQPLIRVVSTVLMRVIAYSPAGVVAPRGGVGGYLTKLPGTRGLATPPDWSSPAQISRRGAPGVVGPRSGSSPITSGIVDPRTGASSRSGCTSRGADGRWSGRGSPSAAPSPRAGADRRGAGRGVRRCREGGRARGQGLDRGGPPAPHRGWA